VSLHPDFLLLAHNVPNVAKRSIWDQCKKKYWGPTGDRPLIWENSNGDISATDHPNYSVFGSRMGFSGLADRMALFLVWPNWVGMWEKTMREE